MLTGFNGADFVSVVWFIERTKNMSELLLVIFNKQLLPMLMCKYTQQVIK